MVEKIEIKKELTETEFKQILTVFQESIEKEDYRYLFSQKYIGKMSSNKRSPVLQ
jgi:hypothetical protein